MARTALTVHRVLSGRPGLIMAVVCAIAAVTFAAGGWAVWFSYDLTAGLPGRAALRGLGDMAQSTTIFDAHDKPAFTIFKEQRIEVPLDRISPALIKAVVSVEDRRFYEHRGVDAIRVAAAVVNNLREGRRAEGGSTITQQLARQSFLSRDKTYRRKLKEVILAASLERMYSKNEILELYLNKVYLGDGLYGVEAAARGYFGKSASDLHVAEAALLAGLIQSPSSYAPTVSSERAIARRNIVLQTMVSSAAIDTKTADQARKIPVRLTNSLDLKETYGLYFKEHVRLELVERFGWQRVYQGGLRVYTTMDPDLQRAAETLVEKAVGDIEKRRQFTHPKRGEHPLASGERPQYLQAALVSMDPSTGHVRAMVGGRDFGESHFNRAVQAKRQPGSAFKPFVYAAAIEAGYSPATLITHLDDPIDTPLGGWVPEDEHSSATSMTLRTGLRTSSNRAAVQLLNAIGIPSAVGFAKKLNVGTPPSVPSLALGAGEVTLMLLTAAYGAFADGGIVRQPVLIRSVEDSDGTVLFSNAGKSSRAVSQSTAFLMSSMLADVISAGTGYRARQSGFTLPAAGKTGTTSDYVDAWFVGFTPHVVTGVWVGFDQPATIMANGYAGELAVPLWASFMRIATKGDGPDWFPRPASVVSMNICRLSGQLPNQGCDWVAATSRDGLVEYKSMIYTEYFIKGRQPNTICPLHTSLSLVDRVASGFGVGTGASGPTGINPPEPARVGTAGTLPAPGPASDQLEAPKRGFWAKIFGRRDPKDNEQKKK